MAFGVLASLQVNFQEQIFQTLNNYRKKKKKNTYCLRILYVCL